jgi:signal transduction histidine kinase
MQIHNRDGFLLKKKLILIFSIIVLGTIAGVITTYLNQQNVKINDKWVEHTVAVLYESEKVLSFTQDVMLIGQVYIMTGDSNSQLKFNSMLLSAYNSVITLKNLVRDNNTQTRRIDSLQKLIFTRIDLSKEMMAIRKQKGFATTQLFINADKGLEEIRNLTSRIQTEEEILLKKRRNTSTNSYSTFTNSFYILIGFTMLLFLIASYIIRRNLQQEKIFRESSILEAKSKEMEQLTYITSHELRHPILTILSYVKIFDEDYVNKLDKKGKTYIQSISTAAKQMEILLSGLFDYSRLSEIKELEAVNCNKIVQNILIDLNALVKSTHAKITVTELPTLKASPLELTQLFQNLITNALKFKKAALSPELSISARKEEGGYRFEFRDNGIGIETRNLKKIFNIFRRLHTTEEYEGSGLGLAHCRKIVELHHGQIWVESIQNKGSSFFFTIKT